MPGSRRGPWPAGPEITYLRGLVELCAHTVTHIVPDHREAVGLHIGLDRMADIGHPAALPSHFDALPKALLGHFDQLFCLIADLTAGIGGGTVAVEAADIGAYVHADDVPLLQLAGTGDPVDDFVVYRNTGRAGIAAIAQKRGLCAMALDKTANPAVSISFVVTPGRTIEPGQRPGLGGQPPALRIASISRGDFREIISMLMQS